MIKWINNALDNKDVVGFWAQSYNGDSRVANYERIFRKALKLKKIKSLREFMTQ